MPPSIPSNLGNKVTTRTTSWQDLVEKAWGSEFRAPDHNIYRFGGGARNYDSTDKGLTGLYGVAGDNLVYLNNKYPDMRDGILVNQDGVTPLGALNNGFGTYVDINADALISASTSSNAPVVETDPQWAFVQLLSFPSSLAPTDQSQNAQSLTVAACPVVSVSDGAMGSKFAYSPNDASLAKIYTPSNAIFSAPANNPFTLEFSVKVLAPVSGTLWIMSISAGVYIQVTAAAGNTFAINATGWNANTIGNLLPLNVWVNCAITYDGTIGRTYLNGVVTSTQAYGVAIQNSPKQFGIVNVPSINSLGAANMLINNVRVTWGFARYGANYTVRSTPFPTSGP